MSEIVGYFPHTSPTWRLIQSSKYAKIFSHDIAMSYLETEILESIDREMGILLGGANTGFYAGVRFLFAEVTYLAHLYYGKNSYRKYRESYYVARFMRRFRILYPECGVLYDVFRHGLMHSHHPKWLKKNNRVSWYISNAAKVGSFGICIPDFTEDVKNAIHQFVSEIQSEKTTNKTTRLRNILDTITIAGKILTRSELRKYARGDFKYVKT